MDWTRVRTLGNGSSATVSLANSRRFGGFVAVKSAEISQSQFLQREQRILSTLSSPFVVSYMGEDVTTENDKLMYNLFMEYVPSGTLSDTIRRHGGRLDESLIGYYTRQVVQGLEYLHSRGLVHCDIKGRNILVGEDGVKIADFGCSRWVNNQPVGIGGTPMFMSPEVARGEEQGLACDIWALGCTVIEMSTGGSPWSNVGGDPVGILYRIAFSGELPEFPSFLSEQAKDFLGKCLKRNPKQRLTASQLLKHPFLEEFNSSPKQIQESNSTSCSPTSILDRGIWNSLEESSETRCCENSPDAADDDRIRRLTMCSGLPDWSWDQSWITIRGNHNEHDADEVEVVGGSGIASVSYNNIEELEIPAPFVRKELVNFLDSNFSDTSSRDSFEDFKCRKNSLECSNFILVRDKDKLLSPLISRFLES